MSERTDRNILVILRSPGYGSHQVQEAMDVALTCAAFGQEVSVLFMDAGVTLLLDDQETDAIGRKSILAQIAAFSIYEIEQVSVCQRSLQKYGLGPDDLADEYEVLDADGLKALMAAQDRALVF